jgi:hypothetical protein
MDFAVSAGIQAASSVASEVVHNATGMYPTNITSAVVTGATYTAVQYFVRGEDNYLSNYGVSAGSEFVARTVGDMLNLGGGAAEEGDDSSEWGE